MNSMKRKTKSILACSLAILTAATTVTPVFAVENSIGSSTADVEGGGQLTGRDPNYTPEKSSEYDEVGEGTNTADVYVSQKSTYTVTLPKTIILDGAAAASNKGTYKVSVDGDISGDEIISVIPKSNNKHINSSHTGDTTTEDGTTCANITDDNVQFYLGQKHKDDIIATVNQQKQAFTTADLQSKDTATPTNTATGEVSTNDISAGSWNGNFYFNIKRMTQTEYDELNDLKAIPNGYKMLYKYDLSATENDDVAAYYCVPNKNTEEITVSKQDESKINNYSLQTTSNQSNNKIIEANGIKYTLSDDDTLVISGSGNMKENIQQDLCGYDALQKDVSEHFGKENIYEDVHGDITTPGKENTTYFLWSINDIEPLYATFTNDGYSTKPVETEVKNYIDTIKDKYMFNLPKTLIVQDGVTNISNLAFYNCTSLTNVTISDSVTSIGLGAFAGCTNLININIPDSVTSIGISAFSECTNLKNIKLPTKLKKISGDMLGGCESLTNIEIPNSVISIDSYAFNYCTSLTSITIPNSVTSIGENTFYFCTSLTNVTMSDSVTSIDEMAFADCTNLTNITLSNSLTSISYGLFDSCTSLTNVTIPNGVTSIGDHVFNGCTSLTSVAIPDSVTSIEYSIFDCTSSSLVIYCQTQAVADFLKETLSSSWNIVVDATKF